jgi:hypothetical protein
MDSVKQENVMRVRDKTHAAKAARPCDRRVSARLSLSIDLCIFGSSVYLLRHTMPSKAALSAEATDITSLIGPVLLASTTSAMVL